MLPRRSCFLWISLWKSHQSRRYASQRKERAWSPTTHTHDGESWAGSNPSFSSSPQVAKVEYVRRRPKLKEVFVRLEDHLECVCTSQHHVVEHSDAETGNFNLHGCCMSSLHYHARCCLFAEKSLWGRVLPSPLRRHASLPSVSLCLALHWTTSFSDCLQTGGHTCEVAHYCKTAKACVCACGLLGRRCVCVRESLCVKGGCPKAAWHDSSALIWSLSLPWSR